MCLICLSSSVRRIEESLSLSAYGQHKTIDQSSTVTEGIWPHDSADKVVVHHNGKLTANDDGSETSSSMVVPYSDEQSKRLDEANLSPQSTRCPAWCSCICHKSSTLRSPHWAFKTLVGQICLQYSGQQAPCNEKSCCRLEISTFNLVYQLPRFLMCRYIAMTMRYTPLDGPYFSIRMPRVTPWNHLLWNYAMVGNLLAIQNMFAEGLASPYDVNVHGSGALNYAVSHNRTEIVRFLLDKGADPELPNDVGRTAVDIYWEKSFAGHYERDDVRDHGSLFQDSGYVQAQQLTTVHKIVLGIVCRELKDELELSTADLNAKDGKGRTPLIWATIRADEVAVETLLAFGADPNITDNYGCTPLHFVTSVGICKLLLAAKVNVNARNAYYGRTALHTYNTRREVDVIDMLVQAGIDVNAQCSGGETALLNAAYNPITEIARRLLELGADVNATSQSTGYSALHFAVEYDRHEILIDLLNRGADYTKRTESGRTILHLAACYSGTETLSILSKANLEGLDMALRDQNGKTAANYLSERCILVEIEESTRDEFHALLQNVSSRNRDIVGSSHSHPQIDKAHVDTVTRSKEEQLRLPGAFPINDETED